MATQSVEIHLQGEGRLTGAPTAVQFAAVHLRGKGSLGVSEEHQDLHGRPVAPTSDAQRQRACAHERHVARWAAVYAAKARGLTWDESYLEAAKTVPRSARGKPGTMQKSYCLIQEQLESQGRLFPE